MGATGKMPFAAVAGQASEEGHPQRVKLRLINSFQKYWVNIVLSNLKMALRSSCHSFDAKYAPQ